MKKLAIIGSGDLGQQIAYYAVQDRQFKIEGFFDDLKNTDNLVNQIPVLGGIKDIFSVFEQGRFDELLIGIGYKHMALRSDLYTRFQNIIPFARLIHSSCSIDQSSIIKEGVVIYPGCIIDHHVTIEPNVLINIGCCIAHDTQIGMNSFLSPRVAVAGFVSIGPNCILGINATIIDNIRIAKQTQIGGGAVVIKHIEASGLYVGNPVKFIR
ncbi:acetyltransferase [Mucilaginibacter sabulilitoris]|uniref:Acetyltransferase n=1 Tax=Mucilaginibacter sabulilitoris TaxID=1173583 RepID=A0ABZ0TRN6_9SPHI|nr:acetyltransferase [Mucilaginibacter sabulilitoris]WPU95790.1 acetyltransferase [Mucilaginibacter sabulilitoris]